MRLANPQSIQMPVSLFIKKGRQVYLATVPVLLPDKVVGGECV